MKKGFVLQSAVCLLAVSCSVHEMETMNPIPAEEDVFYASLETYSTPDTKVYVDNKNTVDGKFMVFWDAEDQISIFNENTLNQKYEFMGETGDNAGYFKYKSGGSGSGTATDYVCAVYPYNKTTTLSGSDVLTLTLPEEQTYREGSFGLKANTMVSTTDGDDNLLRFRNVGGFLVFKFFGMGPAPEEARVSISSIKLEGRNGELLSGEATMTPVINGIPTIEMASTAGASITLKCDKAVKLGKTENKATEFWMVLPPTRFSRGFKVTLTDKDGKVIIRESDADLTIERNHASRLEAIEVTPDDFLNPNQAIYYSTSDNNAISLNEGADFGANLVSNEYSELNKMCVMVFGGDVTKIGDNAFENCETLTDIMIPETVETIGDYAFAGCTSLGAYIPHASKTSKAPAKTPSRSGETTIVIPEGVTSIGDYAFKDCESLTSIIIPDSVTSIGDGAFERCTNLSDIDIPDSVTDLGVNVFNGCSGITSVTIPDGVTSIDDYAFAGCSNLTEVIIPESVTSIGKFAFKECSNLTSIILPANVTTIGESAFEDCENLVSINIPSGIKRIERKTFAACHALPSINFPDGVEYIGPSAFDCCWVLGNVSLPSSVTDICNAAFASCHAFTSFTIPPQVTYVSDDLLSNCDHLSSVDIHEGVEIIEYGAFYHCSSLTEISIPESVTSIGENAFSGSGLTSITIPENVESIGNWAFSECSDLTSFTILAVTPPVINYAPATEGLFLNTDNCPIYVPTESFTAYKEAEVWSNYASRIHTIAPASGEINGHAFVDMGTGLKWATMNVGATAIYEPGVLLAWSDGKAAAENWGESWRLPTKDELETLTDESKFTWTWNSANNGFLISSNIAGFVGNSIFLPAAGAYDPYDPDWGIPRTGWFWSSTPYDGGSYYYLEIDSDDVPFTGQGGLSLQMSIRPVAD